MSVIGSNAPDSAAAGLSARARDLWQASLLYRRLADELAADGVVESRPMPVATSEEEPWLASR